MQKLLITALCSASLAISACSTAKLPGVHRIDVQQGNVVTQEMVDQLKPGMNKRQVSFIMGSPMVTDVFHPDRWDYVYRLQTGDGELEQQRVTLFFTDDALTRIDGDLQPRDNPPPAEPRETTVTVTPPPADKGFLSRLWRSVTQRPTEQAPPPK